MPTLVKCPCGQRLQVRDEDLGKRSRCPSCNAGLQLPPEAVARAAPPAAGIVEASPPTPPTAPVQAEGGVGYPTWRFGAGSVRLAISIVAACVSLLVLCVLVWPRGAPRPPAARPPEDAIGGEGGEAHGPRHELDLPEVVVSRHRGEVSCVGYSRDGSVFAAGGFDGSVVLIDARALDIIATFFPPSVPHSLAFSQDGGTILLGAADGAIYAWDTGRKQMAWRIAGAHKAAVTALAVSPDGGALASSCGGRGVDDQAGQLHLWRLPSREKAVLDGHRAWVGKLCFSPDGGTLASAGMTENTVRLWDVASGAERRAITLGGGARFTMSVCFAAGGKALVVGCGDGTARVVDAGTGVESSRHEGDGSAVTAVAAARGGAVLAGTKDGAIILLGPGGGSRTRGRAHASYVLDLAVSPDGLAAVSAGKEGSAKLWAVGEGGLRAPTPPGAHGGGLYPVISWVAPGGVGGQIGLRRGDVLLRYDGEGLAAQGYEEDRLKGLVTAGKGKASVKIEVLRDGQAQTITAPGGKPLGVWLRVFK